MVELRFTAQKVSGQAISGSLTAASVSEGKKKIYRLAEKNQLNVKSIEKKSTFLYKVKRGSEKPVTGEQKAFNRKEVEDALSKLGYTIVSINKKLIDLHFNPPQTEIVSFVKISAELLEQKLPYSEILTLLIGYTENKTFQKPADILKKSLRCLRLFLVHCLSL